MLFRKKPTIIGLCLGGGGARGFAHLGALKAFEEYGIKFDNEPFLPDFNTFVARNQARGFRETPEQLRS